MTAEKRAVAGSPWFYGWVIVAICALTVFVATGTRSSFGAFFKAIQEELGWDRGTIAGAAALNAAAWALAQPLAGSLIDRYGARWGMVGGVALMVGAAVPLYFAHSVWALYVFYGLLPGAAYAAATIIPTASLIGRWFHAHAGLASGIVAAALTLGQAVAVPLAAVLNAAVGWRLGYLALGAGLLAILPLIVLGVRDAPRPGEVPEAERLGGPRRAAAGAPRLGGLPFRAVLRTREWWLLLTSQCLCGFVDLVVTVHFVPYVSDHGRSEVFAASVMGITSVVAVGGTLGGGWLCDHVDRKTTLFLMHGLRVIALPALMLFGLTGQTAWLAVFVPLYGATIIVGFPATSTLVARLYGARAVGSVYGNLQLGHHLGMATGAWAGGAIYDLAGSYFPAFTLGTLFAAIGAVAVLAIDERPALASQPVEAPAR